MVHYSIVGECTVHGRLCDVVALETIHNCIRPSVTLSNNMCYRVFDNSVVVVDGKGRLIGLRKGDHFSWDGLNVVTSKDLRTSIEMTTKLIKLCSVTS